MEKRLGTDNFFKKLILNPQGLFLDGIFVTPANKNARAPNLLAFFKIYLLGHLLCWHGLFVYYWFIDII